MKYIIKNKSPLDFEEWKNMNPEKTWDDFKKITPIKNQVKESLVKEQGYICCYCGKEIENDEKTVIEHYHPKNSKSYPKKALDYNNFLASCPGGQLDRKEGNKRYPLSCDAKKDNKVISISPLNPECENKFNFTLDGRIIAVLDDQDTKNTIEILGLDSDILKNQRKAVIDGSILEYEIDPNTGKVISKIKSTEGLQEILKSIYQKDLNGRLEPFCFVVKNILEKTFNIAI